jgi:hypothetical protein
MYCTISWNVGQVNLGVYHIRIDWKVRLWRLVYREGGVEHILHSILIIIQTFIGDGPLESSLVFRMDWRRHQVEVR